jgi:formylglycine-generating enzyme required for sulfatase activity
MISQIPDTGLVLIEEGKFLMGNKFGDTDEKPVHKVKIDDFYIGKYEVTNSQYAEFLNSEGNQNEQNAYWILLSGIWEEEKCRIFLDDSIFKVENGYENYPVTYVNWYGANAYCKWKGGRLPTEAEWEYVAKGGKFKNDTSHLNLDYHAIYKLNSLEKVNQISTRQPNSLGIFDLYGNLSEWISDCYSENYYKNSVKKNPQGYEKSNMKVTRGGSWYNNSETLTPTNRRGAPPNYNNITIGFRIAYSIDEK